MNLNDVVGGLVVGLQGHLYVVVVARPNTDLGSAKSALVVNFGRERWKHWVGYEVVVIFAKCEQVVGIVALFAVVEALHRQTEKGMVAGPVEESHDNAEEVACIVPEVGGGPAVAFDLELVMQQVSWLVRA